ncbi:DUF3185 family protein [Nibricoccus sp. IMCC34717]|uniref:DUF3185 family protein n=1 Tax=Nibricoccus sp. IMCC34717 TaxID=3034021 RepID=UPI00384F1EC3
MKRLFGILLLVVGAVMIYQGLNRKDSLAGGAAEAGTKIANSVDGGSRVPKHMFYLIGGGVLAVAGLGLVVSKQRLAVA